MRPRALLLGAAAATLVAALLVAGVLAARGSGPAQPLAAAGSDAGERIGFSGSDVLTGEHVALADFRGKPVVVNIWASWCTGCNAEAAAFASFAEAHPEAVFVGVNVQDTRADARAFHARYGWEFPSVHDPDGEIAYELGLQGTPTTIFLDSEHREVTRIVGATDEQGFADGLAAATGS